MFREMLMSGSRPLTSLPTQSKRRSLDVDVAASSSDWQELTTHQNRTYFMHVPTGRGQWNRPSLLAQAQDAVDVDEEVVMRQPVAAQAAGDGGGSAAAEDPAT
jgi:hypothetical protein